MLVDRSCENCNKTFKVHRSRIKHGRGKTCSRDCQYALIRNKPKATSVCERCGKTYNTFPSKLKTTRYCTRECRDKYWVGKQTPNWQDGIGVYKRGSNWHSIRRKVIRRDDFECQKCGNGENLHVHHIVPFRMYDSDVEANRMENLITLCAPCHRAEDAKSKWVKFDEGCIRMNAGGYAWELHRELLARERQSK